MRTTALALAFTAALAAGQSFFNMHGLGELAPPPDARSDALGGPLAFSNANPGLLVHLPQTRIWFSALTSAALGTESGTSRIIFGVRPQQLDFAVPLPLELRLGLGIGERFNQDFDVWSESTSGSPYRYRVTGKGGIYRLRAAISASVFDVLCLGAGYSASVGGSRENWRFQASNGLYTSTDTIEIDYRGVSPEAGASLQTRYFDLSAWMEPGLTLAAERIKRIHGVVEDSVRSYSLNLPMTLALGAVARPTERLSLTAGAENRPWSGATIDGTPLGYRDVWTVHAGAEYEIGRGYLVRAGYSRGDWYCRGAASIYGDRHPISEQGVHIGAGIPVPKFGAVDIAASVLLRNGATDAGPLREISGRLALTLAYSEAWQRRTRRWGY